MAPSHAVLDRCASSRGEPLEAVRVPSVSVEARKHDDCHMILWQASGTSSVRVADERYELCADQALWIPPGQWHELTVHENSVLLPMFLELDEVTAHPSAPLIVWVDAGLRTLFLADIQAGYSLIRPPAGVSHQLAARFQASPRVPRALPLPVSPGLRRIARDLLERPGDGRSMRAVAQEAQISPRTLERRFLEETGLTLRAWRIRCRMEAAGERIRSGQAPEAAGRAVGYASASAFRRVFKEHHHLTPSDYARRFDD